MATRTDEIAKFEALAPDWWNPRGPMAPLHAMNPARLAVIETAIAARFGRDRIATPRPLTGLRILDVGCGAGLVDEPLARLGATVTGIDAAAGAIEAARAHAAAQDLEIDYRVGTLADLPATTAPFDVVVALEVVEHVDSPAAFVIEAGRNVARGGLLILSTLNRTARSFAGAIVAAEYALGWLPRGTHDWRRFLRPAELAAAVRGAGLRPIAVQGIVPEPGGAGFRPGPDVSINYILTAARD